MTDPATTIREALDYGDLNQGIPADLKEEALAALTELEQQLAAHRVGQASLDAMQRRALSAERECDRLAATLREIVNVLGPDHFAGELEGLVAEGNDALRAARAALDRHTQQVTP